MDRMNPIRFSDSPLRWVSALPMWPDGTHYRGRVFDFLSQLPEIEACLTRQINEGVWLPPILIEHAPDGLARGNGLAWRVLDIEDAARLGVEQKAPKELYFGWDIREPGLAKAYDDGLLSTVSPDIRGTIVDGEPWIDETGAEWPFFVAEISAVSIPHNKRQVAAHNLRGVQMKDKRRVKMSDGTVVEIETEAALPEGATEMEDVAAAEAPLDAVAMAAKIKSLEEAIAALTAGAAASANAAPAPMNAGGAAGVTPPAGPAVPPPIVTMGDKAAIDAAVRKALAERDAAADVDALLAAKQVGIGRATLLHMRMSDKPAFDEIVRMSDGRPPASASGPARVEPGKRSAVRRVAAVHSSARPRTPRR